eukprot:TRINITY_DN1044_c0_g3_i1.p1 TRINITY_DN1044_c0_g3~~TRINITY_DN1044_c0_g3_i1.p1  ORF type:complete len:131 (+),score=36.36 TRINITY_DN1044_c0_g3_i1:246-638(+)
MAVNWTKIRDLVPSAANKPNVVFIVLEKLETIVTSGKDRVGKILIADETACMHLSLWNEFIDMVREGDIIRLHTGHCTLFKDEMTLYMGKEGRIEKIGDFEMIFTEQPNVSLWKWEADPINPKKFIPKPR